MYNLLLMMDGRLRISMYGPLDFCKTRAFLRFDVVSVYGIESDVLHGSHRPFMARYRYDICRYVTRLWPVSL